MADIPHMNKIFEIRSTEMPFPAFSAFKFSPKFMLNILVFEIKKEKTHKKFKKILTVICHCLLEGDSNGRRPRVWEHTTQNIFEI